MAKRDTRIAAPLRAPRSGLLTCANVKDGETGLNWGAGLTWLAELPPLDYEEFDQPGMGNTFHDAQAANCPTDAMTIDARPKIETADAFMVRAYSWCSAIIRNQEDRAARARRLLEGMQSLDIAYEFWTGTIAQAQSLGNSWLANTVGGAATAVVWPDHPFQTAAYAAPTGEPPSAGALGRMDAYLSRVLGNGTGILHMSPEMFAYLRGAFPGWMEQSGNNTWLSPNGHLLCADGGYTGAAKAEEGGALLAEWIVATPPIDIVLGPIETTTPESPEAFGIATNEYVLYAQRDVLIEWDTKVAHGAFQFTNIANVFA